jgi:adenylate cyclase
LRHLRKIPQLKVAFLSLRVCILAILIARTSALFCQQSPEDLERMVVEVNTLLDQSDKEVSVAGKERALTHALRIAKGIDYSGGIVRSLLALGEIRSREGDVESAIQYFIEAEQLFGAQEDKQLYARIKHVLGDLFYAEKLYANARKYYSEALSLDPGNDAAQERIADAFLYEMRFDSAEYLHKQLEKRYREQGNHTGRVLIYQKLADAYNQTGQFSKGLYYMMLMENILEQHGTAPEKATLYNNLGHQHAQMGDQSNALISYKRAEAYCALARCAEMDVIQTNIGVLLHNTGNTKAGTERLQEALRTASGRRDEVRMAAIEQLMAAMYFKSNDLYNALRHNQVAIKLAEETAQTAVMLDALGIAADLHQELYDYEKAFTYYKQYLTLLDSIRLSEQVRQQRLTQQQNMLTEKAGAIRLLRTQQNLKELELRQANFDKERLQSDKDRLELKQRENDLLLLKQQQDLDEARFKEQALQVLRTRQELRLRTLETEQKNRQIEQMQRHEEVERAQRMADSTRRAQELEILRRDKDLQDLQITQQENLQRFLMGLGLLLLLVLALLTAGWWLARQAGRRLKIQNIQIQAQSAQIAEERRKSDQLLRNILPDEIAHELKTKGHASPRLYDAATVVFTDFINFTRLSERLTPKQIIDELDECFLAFDDICEACNLEKIKTIGDAYMCVAGIPIPNDTHALDAVHAARQMVDWLKKRAQNKPDAVFHAMRIGIHTGPVVAGVVGKHKFAYDIWGDAVNLAARMEEQGEEGRINISGATYAKIRRHYRCTHRGKHEVYNKGLVDMYFVEERIEEPEKRHTA